MKKISIICTSVAILILICALLPFASYKFKLVDDAYGIQTKNILNKKNSNASPTETMFDKPWSNLGVDINNIVIYPNRVEPRSTLTFTYTFGNEGTTPIINATIMCLPPNMSLPDFLNPKPFMWYRGEVNKGPIVISQPKIEPLAAATGQVLVERISWSVDTIPQKGSGADTNTIVFQLEVDVSQVEITQDLQCWVGIFYGTETNIPKTFGIVKIRVEVKPKFEIEKIVSKSTILPGETNSITIRYRNNSRMPADNVYIYDYFFSNFRNVADWITIDTIDPQPDKEVLPELVWKNLVIPESSPWNILTVVVRAKPYQEIKNLFQDSPVQIIDSARIELQNENYDSTGGLFRIEAKDLKPQIVPKLFGNSASPGFPLLINAWINNIGATPVYENPPYWVRMWLNDQKGTPFYDEPFNAEVRAGESKYFCKETDPLPAGEGSYRIYIEVDYLNDILEIDETNNIDSVIVNAKIESFNTTVNNVTRSDVVDIYHKMPEFPKSIFSYVMNTDQNYHYIRGLASTAKWLTPDEQTSFGEGTVKSIWNPVKEYHEEDQNIPVPEMQDVYLGEPPLNVTRIDESKPSGFSVFLIMDNNLTVQDASNANLAARTLADHIRSQDQMAVMKASNEIFIPQYFTNDRKKLHDAINKEYSRSNVLLLNDAVYRGVTEIFQTTGRKAILVFTSGQNSGSSHSLKEVIEYAATSGVPVFTFGFGNADTISLSQLAQYTGGLFVYDKASRDMWYILKLFAEMFKNYYLLSHKTTDETLDGTWRLVDVTASYPSLGFSDRDIGKYKAPNEGVDLFITKEAKTDSFSVGAADTIGYAREGEQYSYTIIYGNLGSLPGRMVMIKDVLPDLVDFVSGSANPPPVSQGRQLLWGPIDVIPGARGTITFDVIVKTQMPPWQIALIDSAFIIYDQDQKPDNNSWINIVYAVGVPPDPPILRATPEKIRPRDPIIVELQCFEELREWDIKVYFEDGNVISTFFDGYIAAHPILLPVEAIDKWHLIVPEFKDTQKHTDKPQEKITVKLTAKNVYGQSFEAEDFVIVEASFELSIYPIIIKPGVPDGGDRVDITLTLPADQIVTTRIYNVAGELVRKLEDKFFLGGEKYINALSWDVRDNSGNLVASDVYIIVVKAGSHEAWQKVVVIR